MFVNCNSTYNFVTKFLFLAHSASGAPHVSPLGDSRAINCARVIKLTTHCNSISIGTSFTAFRFFFRTFVRSCFVSSPMASRMLVLVKGVCTTWVLPRCCFNFLADVAIQLSAAVIRIAPPAASGCKVME